MRNWRIRESADYDQLSALDYPITRSPDYPITRLPDSAIPPWWLMNKIDEIRRLYFETSPKTIQLDLDRAIDLVKSMSNDEERSTVAVYMEGLNEMRKEWKRPQGRPRSRRQQ